jgi:hypothetical protein
MGLPDGTAPTLKAGIEVEEEYNTTPEPIVKLTLIALEPFHPLAIKSL